nr:MAG TPA: hypothetical protein [Caudoviricetes sp.]
MLNDIKQALEKLGYKAYYGRSLAKPNDDWNYFVFNKSRTSRSGTNRMDYNKYYQVHFICEDYIEEDFEFKIIKQVTENTKLKLADTEIAFNYITKNNTDRVVEICTIEFTKAKKGCEL